MDNKHFELISSAIRESGYFLTLAQREELAKNFLHKITEKNPRFVDKIKFWISCGLTPAPGYNSKGEPIDVIPN